MGIFCTKEDEVSKISTSIFVSNFSDSFSSKNLFHACKQYGHVVDSFILSKRAKDGKRFGFVRFINVFSIERLVNNLCTIWVGRLKLNANVARFNRENLKSSRIVDKTAKRFNKSSHNTFHKTAGNKDIGNSFVNVVNGSGMSLETESTSTIVLDDECLNTKDPSCSLMGRVKEFTSLSNLKKVLCNEGFDVLKISYLGHTFNHIASKWGKLMEVDDYDDTNFHSKILCILTKSVMRLIDEPTSAAISYGLDTRLDLYCTEEKNIVIFDMGGKRFDVSLVNLNKAGFISVKSSSGDPHMGGDDFDKLIVNHCVHENIINAHTDVVNVEDEDV
nr:nucleotide-binding alpha-beta plait domain-containing protein [Tanacetum cinerariifolium]